MDALGRSWLSVCFYQIKKEINVLDNGTAF